MENMKNATVKVYHDINMDVRQLSFVDGSHMLVLPHGGRVIGLFTGDCEKNFLWTNPVLKSAKSAKELYASDNWHNSGGDRTWIAPEIDLFYPNAPGDSDDYFQPRSLDPGNYQVTDCSGTIQLKNKFIVTPYSTKIPINAEITKLYYPAYNPLRHCSIMESLSDIQYAGYTQHTSLRLLDSNPENNIAVGIWNLLQLPGNGDMIIPTLSFTQPFVYFGEIPDGDLLVNDEMILYKMHASGGQKIGVKAYACAGRAGYLQDNGDQSILVIRSFRVDPSSLYVDIPFNTKEKEEFVFQACNINNELGSFSELEYHTGAIGGSTGLTYLYDESQVWAYCGRYKQLVEIVKILLSSKYTK